MGGQSETRATEHRGDAAGRGKEDGRRRRGAEREVGEVSRSSGREEDGRCVREEEVDGGGAESVVMVPVQRKGAGEEEEEVRQRERKREKRNGGEIGGVSGLSRPLMESKCQREAK